MITIQINLWQLERIIEYMNQNNLRDIDQALTSILYQVKNKVHEPK